MSAQADVKLERMYPSKVQGEEPKANDWESLVKKAGFGLVRGEQCETCFDQYFKSISLSWIENRIRLNDSKSEVKMNLRVRCWYFMGVHCETFVNKAGTKDGTFGEPYILKGEKRDLVIIAGASPGDEGLVTGNFSVISPTGEIMCNYKCVDEMDPGEGPAPKRVCKTNISYLISDPGKMINWTSEAKCELKNFQKSKVNKAKK